MATLFAGSRAVFKINGQLIGLASGMEVNQENTLTDADVLGKLEVEDFVETAHKVTFSCTVFKAVSATQKSQGVAVSTANSAAAIGFDVGVDAKHGQGGALGTAGKPTDMRHQQRFDCAILDENDNVVYEMSGCKFEGGNGTVDARGIWTGRWNFKAIKGRGI